MEHNSETLYFRELSPTKESSRRYSTMSNQQHYNSSNGHAYGSRVEDDEEGSNGAADIQISVSSPLVQPELMANATLKNQLKFEKQLVKPDPWRW